MVAVLTKSYQRSSMVQVTDILQVVVRGKAWKNTRTVLGQAKQTPAHLFGDPRLDLLAVFSHGTHLRERWFIRVALDSTTEVGGLPLTILLSDSSSDI